MGMESVAVYSDFDRDALHVRMADKAVPIGGSPATESYLNIEAIIQAAKRTRADAIHPGYGFLAENPELAAACESAAIAFIGPRPSVIRAMGSKTEARKLAQEAGVQVVPGFIEEGSTEEDFARCGFPLLIKASAGGGGRGMRIVQRKSEFQEAVTSARSEAERAFGDGSLLIEKYVEDARHVEIQIFGDLHGNVMHLGERDCSVQRRHQKIIAESPAPTMTVALREKIAEAALILARKLGYTNAGTVEFLLAPSGEFYFIEVNTRIQVEHPVTEMVTGLDLVRMQIEIAQGQSLPPQRSRLTGHAIEARLYAEQPTNGFLPSTGKLQVWEPPSGMDGVRVDSGVETGTEIGVYYDPLLAKIIAHGPDRETAIRKLVYALRHCAAQGVETNREFLIDVLESEDFRAGRAHTGFKPQPQRHAEHDQLFANVAQAYLEQAHVSQRTILPSVAIGYRNNPYHRPTTRLEIGGKDYQVGSAVPGCEILRVTNKSVEALVGGIRHEFAISTADEITLHIRSTLGQKTVIRLPRYPRRAGVGGGQTANSPMPGQVLRVLVAEGQRVKLGDALIALEAMKMEQTIKATMDGVVGAILVKPGDIVAPGQKLVEIQSEKSNEHTDSSAAASD